MTAMSGTETFRVRLRFRVQKRLNISEPEYRFLIGKWEAVLSPPVQDTLIRGSEWLVLNVRGFASEKEARDFGRSLKTAAQISSIASRQGIDAGVDAPTSGVGEIIREQYLREGQLIRDNVHGLDVFPDFPNVRIFTISGTGTVLKEPNPFLSDLAAYMHEANNVSHRVSDVALLLNFALMRAEPVAQIVFSISAVEMLGQNEDWSADQKRLLQDLARSAVQSETGTSDEREEVAVAIIKSLHKLSLRQGVMRLLDSLQLRHLQKEWDQVYKERSTLVHGLAPEPGADYSSLADRAISLCGRILLAAVAREVPLAASHVDRFYPLAS